MAYGIDATVQQKADAYRGNPAPLEQQYAQNQQLIDLLALQKIKSDKEAAARQMQMAMAQKQASQGIPSTIASQREQEVLEMTKQEMAQQATGVAQQQQQQQQKTMQQLLQSGIAQNAAPNVARMAGGGIVAFAGPEGSYVGGEFGDAGSAIKRGIAGIQKYDEDAVRRRELVREVVRKFAGDPTKRDLLNNVNKMSTPELEKLAGRGATSTPTQPTQPMTAADLRSLEAKSGDPYLTGPAEAPPVMPRQDTTPQAATPAVPTAPRAPAAPAQDPFRAKLEAAAEGMFGQDPQKLQLAEEARVEQRRQLTPEQRKVYEEGIGGLQAMYQERFDPDRMKRERLQRGLMAAAGGGGFAAAGTGLLNTREAQEAAQRQAFEGMQGKREGLIGIERDAVKEGIGAGQKTYEQGSMTQRQGIASGTNLAQLSSNEREKALDREVERARIQVSEVANKLRSGELTQVQASTQLNNAITNLTRFEGDIEKRFNEDNAMLLMAEKGGKLKPEQKAALDQARATMNAEKKRIRERYVPIIQQAEKTLGVSMPSTAAPTLTPGQASAMAKHGNK
jgi:hypothetical protein